MEISYLPQECIALIISLTTPRDACRSSLVSPLFRSVADSDVVWQKFLPSDYQNLICQSVVFRQTTTITSKKSLYFHLSSNPTLIGDDRNLSFSIDRESGKKCFMVGARKLEIIWGDTSHYWRWITLPESRFPEVALLNVLEENQYNFDRRPVELRIQLEGREEMEGFNVLLKPPSRDNINNNMTLIPQDRGDGWKEIEMGHFFNEDGDHDLVLCTLKELEIIWGDKPHYWRWISLPESRFPEVALLNVVWWLHVSAKLETKILSPKTTYTAYLVFKLEENQYNFDRRPVELCIQLEGREEMEGFNVFLKPPSRNNINNMTLISQDRGDGWKEIKMGQFFNEGGDHDLVLCTLKEVSCATSWSGLILEGIEFRPTPPT
ncbi:hypothetical protein G4B88_030257 [Cannabis sativa]|uniref:F-box domain-containing protein n=1 Tax=Cannabis sativa TaxID=3483 RepID=A0A7J6DNY4_CANSA|nr:hypothetical protein G4B88_030257 [Cannabis sativa]